MPIKIEEAFNDCFERLSAGESLDSCLHDYEEYSAELDMMLRTTFDIKRRAFPVQPRPEFKYWARVRLQGVQDYVSRQPVQARPSGFNLRRNLAISMAALLVFVIASSGTVAASSDSLPDEPLYGVKLAVEQAQVTLAFSDVDKAELYAHLAEKRAGEIVAMAQQGKTDKMETTTTKMNYQLDQAEQFISKYEEANPDTASVEAAASSVPSTTLTSPAPTVINPPDKSAATTVVPGGQQDNLTLPAKPLPAVTRAAININRAKNTMSATTAESLAELQNALEKAPDSAKPALLEVIQRTKKANERAHQQLNLDNNQQALPSGSKPVDPHPFNKPNWKNALPQGGENNQTGATDTSDDNKSNRTNTVPNWNLPKTVNPVDK